MRVLLLLDIGGSMDDHIRQSAELFGAARSEFKHLEFYYFHNCPYERLWKDNRRRRETTVSTDEVMRTYGPAWRLIFVGDAAMSPHEIIQPGGSVEHYNDEPGQAWMRRLTAQYRRAAWLNPSPVAQWPHARSVELIRTLMDDRMFPLTLGGLDDMARALSR